MDWKNRKGADQGQIPFGNEKRLTHLFFLDGLIDEERGPERCLLCHLDIHCEHMSDRTSGTRRTCFASTA